jgi:hypothetical protein
MFRKGWGGYRFLYDRQFYDKPRSHRMILFDTNRSMMIFHDPAHNRQSKAGASLLG